MSRILVVEDEPRISSFIAKGLKAAGFTPTIAGDGMAALSYALSGEFDLVVLDINLPILNGFEVLDELRTTRPELPVIMLTARDASSDTVAALEGGAVDYMVKPFNFAELVARIRLRLGERRPVQETATELIVGDVRLDLLTRRASVAGDEVDLSSRELTLAAVLMEHQGQVLSREQLLSHVWGYDFDPGSNVVDVYIGYLRKKLGSGFIQTVRGLGYRVE